MGVDVSAYVEKKNKDTGKWELVTNEPVSSRLKYILEDWNELPKVQWEELSEGLQKKFNRDENGLSYSTYYTTTLDNLENDVAKRTNEAFTRINTIVKALGAERIYRDDGEECVYGDDIDRDKLTIPINIDLVEDLQMEYGSVRKIGQIEALDVILSEHIGWDGEYRIVLVAS